MPTRIDFTFSDSSPATSPASTRPATASTCSTTDGREYRGHADRDHLRRDASATWARRTSTPPARCATCCSRALRLRLRRVLPGRRGASDCRSRPSTSSSSGEAANEYRVRAPGLVDQPDPPARRLLPRRRVRRRATIDFRELPHRPRRSLGTKTQSGRQETDTISRLVYGFASAYLLTGEDRYLEAAENGTEYLREHSVASTRPRASPTGTTPSTSRPTAREQKIFASEFGDDYDAIPCYEQIYALAGPTQTYRITGDPKICEDHRPDDQAVRPVLQGPRVRRTRAGYYSHIDPITFDPRARVTLGHNRDRKNWNSVGDHAPAYLINLCLATGEEEYADFLEYTFDTIAKHFPDYDEQPVRPGEVLRRLVARTRRGAGSRTAPSSGTT